MSVQTLRAAIAVRARELRVPVLLSTGVTMHKRGSSWRECDCSWCATKRKATVDIANLAHVPAHRLVANNYISDRSLRAAYRDELRAGYRQTLRRLENDDQGLFDG